MLTITESGQYRGTLERTPGGDQELLEPTGWAQTSVVGSHGPGTLLTSKAKCVQRRITAILTLANTPCQVVICISWKKPRACYSAQPAVTKSQREWLDPRTFISPTFGGWTSRIKVPTREVSFWGPFFLAYRQPPFCHGITPPLLWVRTESQQALWCHFRWGHKSHQSRAPPLWPC